eukprot:GHVQ01028653.1.p1 GENE.GHVQ01028653.1~~GHVQ01028653.1.p1  ORF type:complete len:452 (-),score=36.30 GHVQ01028653.1:241-1596(-)
MKVSLCQWTAAAYVCLAVPFCAWAIPANPGSSDVLSDILDSSQDKDITKVAHKVKQDTPPSLNQSGSFRQAVFDAGNLSTILGPLKPKYLAKEAHKQAKLPLCPMLVLEVQPAEDTVTSPNIGYFSIARYSKKRAPVAENTCSDDYRCNATWEIDLLSSSNSRCPIDPRFISFTDSVCEFQFDTIFNQWRYYSKLHKGGPTTQLYVLPTLEIYGDTRPYPEGSVAAARYEPIETLFPLTLLDTYYFYPGVLHFDLRSIGDINDFEFCAVDVSQEHLNSEVARPPWIPDLDICQPSLATEFFTIDDIGVDTHTFIAASSLCDILYLPETTISVDAEGNKIREESCSGINHPEVNTCAVYFTTSVGGISSFFWTVRCTDEAMTEPAPGDYYFKVLAPTPFNDPLALWFEGPGPISFPFTTMTPTTTDCPFGEKVEKDHIQNEFDSINSLLFGI